MREENTYKQITAVSSIVSVTHEEASDAGDSYTVVLRVLNASKWQKLIHSILKSSYEEETYGVSIRQEFYVNDEGSPAFVWSMLLWGDLDEAYSSLKPILSKRGAPPAPPKSLNVSIPTTRRPQVTKTRESIITEVPLPFRRTEVENKDEVINVRSQRTSRKPRAFVEGVKN